MRVKLFTRHSATDRGSADFFNDGTSRETIIGRNLWNEVELGEFSLRFPDGIVHIWRMPRNSKAVSLEID